jgi:hypothetical protein
MCRLPGFATWPCDELNPLWRTGNSATTTDALPRAALTPRIERRIRAAFDRQAAASVCSVLVEKTCANCLRPEFVRQCFPEAKFVQIVRNAVDTTSSTLGRWNANFDFKYALRKVRFVPKQDLPRTVFRAIMRRVFKHGEAQERPWGPVLPVETLPQEPLSAAAYAVLQWAECVKRTDSMLEKLPTGQSCSIRYEDFVADPARSLSSAVSCLGFKVTDRAIEDAVGSVHQRSVGLGQGVLADEARSLLETRAVELMLRHGYVLDANY